jgi:pimeloyl-ACP methyl ester carboxylesterase
MSWIFQIPFFKRKMKVIALHNRGTGKSSRPNYSYTMEMFLEDIKNLLDFLKIEEKIHLCGISMGGMIAQNFILKYPDIVKTLILCATTAKFDSTSLIEAQRLMEKFDLEQEFKVRVSVLYSRPFRKKLKKDKNLYELIKKEFMEDPTTLQDYINQGAAVTGYDTSNSLYKIKHPTLILVGDEDRIIPTLVHSEFLHENIPNSLLQIIEGTGHGFVTEAADEVNKLIWEFIKEHLG